MAKRKAGRPKTGNSKSPGTTATGRKFEIPRLLKTEPIYVEHANTPAIYDGPVSKVQTIPGVEENDILFKCDGCGKPGSYLLQSGYRLVKTAMLVEVGTQTGSDEMATTDPFYYDSVPTTSAAVPLFGEF